MGGSRTGSGEETDAGAVQAPGHEAPAGLWVFGYGSLMWRPGFPFLERHAARVRGYHRSLCVYSHVHRGTPERPGLVLGLDRGGSCRGVAFRVDPAHTTQTIAYLRAREQATAVYLERRLEARLADGRLVPALTYVVDRAHLQYAGRLHDAETLRIVRGGVGRSGANPDYVLSTAVHLVELGVHDPHLARLAAALAEDASRTASPAQPASVVRTG
ncbi:MAG: gamma-glutamylcyclotransferase [Salinarimonas sp.]